MMATDGQACLKSTDLPARQQQEYHPHLPNNNKRPALLPFETGGQKRTEYSHLFVTPCDLGDKETGLPDPELGEGGGVDPLSVMLPDPEPVDSLLTGGALVFPCDVCQKSCTTEQQLKYHRMIHSGAVTQLVSQGR